VDAVLTLLLDGRLEPPRGGGCGPLVAALLEVLSPSTTTTPETLAELSRRLYREHGRLFPLAGQRWLDRLDALARSEREPPPPPLAQLLESLGQSQWLLVDGLGPPLVASFTAELESLLPAWHHRRTRWASVSDETTTQGCYRLLAESGVQHALHKVTCLDHILHERFAPLDDLARLAFAELRLELGGLRRNLDPTRSLAIFADHGPHRP
jgi:hypothetical protein